MYRYETSLFLTMEKDRTKLAVGSKGAGPREFENASVVDVSEIGGI